VKTYGQHASEVADSVRSGPLGEMRAVTRLTPKDRRRGAERAEKDAACRRRAADRMERDGIESIVPSQVVVLGEEDRPA
jgi:hypothetical protein